jgi:molybdopterin/thiamine biosynthesis adenylyltransferase
MGNTDRFKDAPWFEHVTTTSNICVIGAGGIGSWVSLFLSRMQPRVISVYDSDVVEQHNMGGQLFRTTDIGKPKVIALRDSIVMYSNYKINAHNTVVSNTNGIVPYVNAFFSCVDSMRSRKTIAEIFNYRLKHASIPNLLLIDGRLSAEFLQIYCVSNENIHEYMENHLPDDKNVEDTACTFKQTSHVAAMIASLMVSWYTNHVTNIVCQDDIREVPFFTEIAIPSARIIKKIKHDIDK